MGVVFIQSPVVLLATLSTPLYAVPKAPVFSNVVPEPSLKAQ